MIYLENLSNIHVLVSILKQFLKVARSSTGKSLKLNLRRSECFLKFPLVPHLWATINFSPERKALQFSRSYFCGSLLLWNFMTKLLMNDFRTPLSLIYQHIKIEEVKKVCYRF
jgi:hypothetical protein